MSPSSTTSNEVQLREWFKNEQSLGLLDFKCFASTDQSLPSSVAVKDACDMLQEEMDGHYENLAGVEI